MAPIASILHSVRAIAEIVRTGDIGAVAFSVSSVLNKQVVVEMHTHARTVSHTRKRATGGRDVGAGMEGSRILKQVMVETILSPTQLLVAVINTNANGYNNLLCHVGTSKHWNFERHTINTLTLNFDATPQLQNVTNWREAIDGQLQPLAGVQIDGTANGVTLSNIALDNVLVARFLVADVSYKQPRR